MDAAEAATSTHIAAADRHISRACTSAASAGAIIQRSCQLLLKASCLESLQQRAIALHSQHVIAAAVKLASDEDLWNSSAPCDRPQNALRIAVAALSHTIELMDCVLNACRRQNSLGVASVGSVCSIPGGTSGEVHERWNFQLGLPLPPALLLLLLQQTVLQALPLTGLAEHNNRRRRDG